MIRVLRMLHCRMIVQLQFLPRDDEHILPPVRPQQSRSLPKPIASLPSFFILLLSEVLVIVPHIPLSSSSTTPKCSQCESVHSSGFHNRQFAAKTSAPADCDGTEGYSLRRFRTVILLTHQPICRKLPRHLRLREPPCTCFSLTERAVAGKNYIWVLRDRYLSKAQRTHANLYFRVPVAWPPIP